MTLRFRLHRRNRDARGECQLLTACDMMLLFLALHYLCGTASTAPTSGAASTTLDKADGPVLVINGADYRSTGQIGYVVLSLSEGMSNSRSHRER
jgi:hypothetical protein